MESLTFCAKSSLGVTDRISKRFPSFWHINPITCEVLLLSAWQTATREPHKIICLVV